MWGMREPAGPPEAQSGGPVVAPGRSRARDVVEAISPAWSRAGREATPNSAGSRRISRQLRRGIYASDTANLSAKAQFQRDEANLYPAVTVPDNVFCQPYSEDGVWQADSLQMMFDPTGDGNDTGHHEDDYEYGAALMTKGPQTRVWRSPDNYKRPAADIKAAVRRAGDVTTHEVAIAARRLACAKLAPGSRFRYNLVVNDKDGPEPGASVTGGWSCCRVPEEGTRRTRR
jgi:hypothetical protein